MDEWVNRVVNQRKKNKDDTQRKKRFMEYYGKKDDREVMK